jgi:hypothetical protein
MAGKSQQPTRISKQRRRLACSATFGVSVNLQVSFSIESFLLPVIDRGHFGRVRLSLKLYGSQSPIASDRNCKDTKTTPNFQQIFAGSFFWLATPAAEMLAKSPAIVKIAV